MAQIGFIGLGRMGGNMVARIKRDSDHDVVAFDFDQKAVDQAAKGGALPVKSLNDLVKKLAPPRVVWIMVPAGDPTQQTVDKLAKILDKDDTIVDGGNSKWTDDMARAAQLKKLGIHYVDVGTSGGVWGLEVGYCMMVGGPNKAVKRLAPFLDVLAPHPDEEHGPGWGHMGPTGAGHYVKMVHNGIEYGMMQAYAEGFDIFKNATSKDLPEEIRYDLNLADVAEVWRRGSVVSSWLLDLTAIALAESPTLSEYSGFVQDSGEGRWTIQAAIDEAVPAEVLTASLYARFRSRQEHTFADKMLSAMRQKFGGHVEPKAQPK
jgi:6-phosphogluconate dehydrogenase